MDVIADADAEAGADSLLPGNGRPERYVSSLAPLGPPAPQLKPHELGARAELDAGWAAHRAELKRRQATLRRQAQAAAGAMDGWMDDLGPPEEREAQWLAACRQAGKDYHSGRFLIERLGAERYMDPALMATIWRLRQQLLMELVATTHAEAMLVDLTILSYYNALRIQGWIGNLAMHLEHEFFGLESPTAKLKQRWGKVEGLRVEAVFQRFSEQLIPLLDRANRQLIRNLRALRELRQGPVPSVSIGAAGQVNVASQQANLAGSASAQPAPGT